MNLNNVSTETRKRYLINMSLFILLIGVTVSSAYFLYVPGGYQGGRNPRYWDVFFGKEDDTEGEFGYWYPQLERLEMTNEKWMKR